MTVGKYLTNNFQNKATITKTDRTSMRIETSQLEVANKLLQIKQIRAVSLNAYAPLGLYTSKCIVKGVDPSKQDCMASATCIQYTDVYIFWWRPYKRCGDTPLPFCGEWMNRKSDTFTISTCSQIQPRAHNATTSLSILIRSLLSSRLHYLYSGTRLIEKCL